MLINSFTHLKIFSLSTQLASERARCCCTRTRLSCKWKPLMGERTESFSQFFFISHTWTDSTTPGVYYAIASTTFHSLGMTYYKVFTRFSLSLFLILFLVLSFVCFSLASCSACAFEPRVSGWIGIRWGGKNNGEEGENTTHNNLKRSIV